MHNFCRSDAQLYRSDAQPLQVGCTTFELIEGRMHNFCRSDAQLIVCRMHNFQVGCTTFVGRMHNFCMSDAQLYRSDAQLLQVGCTTYSRSDTHLLQVGCTTLVGRMHNFLGLFSTIRSKQYFFAKIFNNPFSRNNNFILLKFLIEITIFKIFFLFKNCLVEVKVDNYKFSNFKVPYTQQSLQKYLNKI